MFGCFIFSQMFSINRTYRSMGCVIYELIYLEKAFKSTDSQISKELPIIENSNFLKRAFDRMFVFDFENTTEINFKKRAHGNEILAVSL